MRTSLPSLALAFILAGPGRLLGEENADRPGTQLKVAMTTADRYSRDEKKVFAPDAPAIYAVYRIVAASPTTLRAVFWADSVEGLDPKTKLLDRTITISEKGEFMGAVPALKPPNGWPAGSYRVEFLLNEKPERSVSFRVEKPRAGP